MATATTPPANNTGTINDLFTSLISDVKSYSGKDPLLPWLRGIKKMKESLPSHTLNQKLPRFLQKCAQTFETDRRYRNDLRYLRVWLQLMDFVDDPRAVLQTMEVNKIGMKKSLFYQAFALYYEKVKKFDEAEKMYHWGVQNLAEPIDELQKGYEQFLQRMQRHRKKKFERQGGENAKRQLCTGNNLPRLNETKENNEVENKKLPHVSSKKLEPRIFCGENRIVAKFVDTAVVGKSEAEDVCDHGLVDPTINMKEAMNVINSMFQEPLQTTPVRTKSSRNQHKEKCHHLNNGFEVFVDENLENGIPPSRLTNKGSSLQQNLGAQTSQPLQEPFKIYVDEEDEDDNNGDEEEDNLEKSEGENSAEGSTSSHSRLNAFVFPNPKDDTSNDRGARSLSRPRFREDTVVHSFVGSTIVNEPEVENVCHHGLVDPTINLKEAMEDINNMFGKPIDFVRARRTKKLDKAPSKNQEFCGFSILADDDLETGEDQAPSKSANKVPTKNQDLCGFSILPDDDLEPQHKQPQGNSAKIAPANNQDFSGFSILPDDDLEPQQKQPPPKSTKKSRDSSDLFEPTSFTKEAMDDINKMFGMPL